MDPDVGGTRQDLLCEGENAFNVDLLKLRPVTINPREREFLTQMVPMGDVAFAVDRLVEDVGMLEAIEFLPNRVGACLGGRDFSLHV